MLPLSDGSTVIFSAPIFAQFINQFMVRAPETPDASSESSVISSFFSAKSLVMKGAFAGVGLVTKPSFIFGGEMDWNQLEGVGFALISSIAMAVMYIEMDKLNKTNPAVVIFWSSAVSLLCSLIILSIVNKFTLPTNYEWYLLAANTGLGIIGDICLALALYFEDAGPVTLGRTVSIVVALILQVQVMGIPLSMTSIAGAVIVGGCVSFSILKEVNPELEKRIESKIEGVIEKVKDKEAIKDTSEADESK